MIEQIQNQDLNHRLFRLGVLLLILVLLIVLGSLAKTQAAQISTDFSLDWWTADGGGGILGDPEGYQLVGTIGQAEAGTISGNDYTVVGGFLTGISEWITEVFLPLVIK